MQSPLFFICLLYIGSRKLPQWPKQRHGSSANRWLQDLRHEWDTYPLLFCSLNYNTFFLFLLFKNWVISGACKLLIVAVPLCIRYSGSCKVFKYSLLVWLAKALFYFLDSFGCVSIMHAMSSFSYYSPLVLFLPY